jgi:hypothetical protein
LIINELLKNRRYGIDFARIFMANGAMRPPPASPGEPLPRSTTATLYWNAAQTGGTGNTLHAESLTHPTEAYHIVNYAQLDTDVPATHDYLYYRLVQHDFDGTIAIHDPIVLRRVQGGVRNTLDSAVLYPNPFGDELTIIHAIDEEDVQIEIADALGRVVYTANRIVSHQTIALDHLPAGLYHATISSSSAHRVHKIIKH